MGHDAADCRYDQLHNVTVSWTGPADQETDRLVRDLVAVESSAHQTMVIIGPWFEARVAYLVRQWLPDGWTTSGPSQIFDPDRPGLRSRSWDVVVHRSPLTGLPPEAFPGAGYPLLPKSDVAVVIDTKTHFSTPREYAAKPIFNLMNDATEPQFALLGPKITKILFIARSDRSSESLAEEGRVSGIDTYCLARAKSSPVSDGAERSSQCVLSVPQGGLPPLEQFRRRVRQSISENFE